MSDDKGDGKVGKQCRSLSMSSYYRQSKRSTLLQSVSDLYTKAAKRKMQARRFGILTAKDGPVEPEYKDFKRTPAMSVIAPSS